MKSLKLQTVVFSDATPYGTADGYKSFARTYCIRLQGRTESVKAVKKEKFSPYLTEHTLSLHYKDHSVNAVWGK